MKDATSNVLRTVQSAAEKLTHNQNRTGQASQLKQKIKSDTLYSGKTQNMMAHIVKTMTEMTSPSLLDLNGLCCPESCLGNTWCFSILKRQTEVKRWVVPQAAHLWKPCRPADTVIVPAHELMHVAAAPTPRHACRLNSCLSPRTTAIWMTGVRVLLSVASH